MSQSPRLSDCSRRTTLASETVRVAKETAEKRCGVCAEAGDDISPLLTCQSCEAAVHAECYYCDSTAASRASFTCRACACKQEPLAGDVPVCVLCNAKGGALFRSAAPGQWVHGVCATFVRGVYLRRDADGSHFVADGVNAVLARCAAPSPFRITRHEVPPRLGGGDVTTGACGGDGQPSARVDPPCTERPRSPPAPSDGHCRNWNGCLKNKDCVRESKHRGVCKIVPDPPPHAPPAAPQQGSRATKAAKRGSLSNSLEKSCRGRSSSAEPAVCAARGTGAAAANGIRHRQAHSDSASKPSVCTPADQPEAAAAASSPPSADAEGCCQVCGGGPPCGYAQCAADGCGVLLHPQCCLKAGLVLGSVPHFGADLHFVLCKHHSVGGGATYAPNSVLRLHSGDGAGGGGGGRGGEGLVSGSAGKASEPPLAKAYTVETFERSRNQSVELSQGQLDHFGGDSHDAELAISLRRCYLDEAHLTYCFSHESRATKLSRLRAPGEPAAPPPSLEPVTSRNTHPGHMPPPGRAYHYDLGSERTGADGRTWRVVADEKRRHRWAALDAAGRPTGLVAGVAKLARPAGRGLAGGRGAGAFRRGGFGSVGGAQVRRLGAGGDDQAPLGSVWQGLKEGCEELSGEDVDAKLWPGAAAEGWRVCEAYRGGMKASNFKYVAPWGFYFTNKAQSIAAKEAKATAVADPTEILE